jgi:hypothetical protein
MQALAFLVVLLPLATAHNFQIFACSYTYTAPFSTKKVISTHYVESPNFDAIKGKVNLNSAKVCEDNKDPYSRSCLEHFFRDKTQYGAARLFWSSSKNDLRSVGENTRFGWLNTADGVDQHCKKSSKDDLYSYTSGSGGAGLQAASIRETCWMIAECCNAC